MATTTPDISERLQAGGYTLSSAIGLLQELAVAPAAKTATDSPATFAAADVSPAAARKAGKQVVAAVFKGASFPGVPPVLVSTNELPQLFALLTQDYPFSTAEELNKWAQGHLSALQKVCKQFVTHASKLANTGSDCAFSAGLRRAEIPYLCSLTVETDVRSSFVGNAGQLPLAKFLSAKFRLEGKVTSLLEGLQEGAGWLPRTGLGEAVLAALTEVAQARSEATLKDRVAQVFWPVDDGHILVSPLPSIAVLDALKTALRHDRLAESLPGRRLETASMKIGGAKPANAGAFNVACSGDHEIFFARVPRLPPSVAGRVARGAKAPDWLRLPRKHALEALVLDLPVWNNKSRAGYVRNQAEGIATVALAFTLEAAAAIELGDVEVDAALAKRLANNAAYQWAVDRTNRPKAAKVAALIVQACAEAHAPLKDFPERCHALAEAIVNHISSSEFA